MIIATRNYDDWLSTNQADYKEDNRPVCSVCGEHFSEGYDGFETICEDCFNEKYQCYTEGEVLRCDICGKVIGTVDTTEPYYNILGDILCTDCATEDRDTFFSD